MNWYKKSQFTSENIQNVEIPIITVQPYEPIVQEVVQELYNEQPQFFIGVNKINVDMGYGQFGSVESINPADININFNRIKSEVSSQIKENLDLNNFEHIRFLKDAVRKIIIHEKAHVQDALKTQESSKIPLSGEELFPGGESVAQRAENM